LKNEPESSYENLFGETVAWTLSRVLCIEELADVEHGDEVIGFIAEIDEIAGYA
jgi:hypothetical protein